LKLNQQLAQRFSIVGVKFWQNSTQNKMPVSLLMGEHECLSLATANTDEGVIPETSDCFFNSVFSTSAIQFFFQL